MERRHRETMSLRAREHLEARVAAAERCARSARGDVMDTVVAPLEAELLSLLARNGVLEGHTQRMAVGESRRRWLWVLVLWVCVLVGVTLRLWGTPSTACDSWPATVSMAIGFIMLAHSR